MMIKITLNVERWKFNKEYGIYVSNQGHFKNRDKKMIAPKVNQSGYLCVAISNGELVLAHRAVMNTWRPTVFSNKLTVDHLDHNKRNNALSNLEWVSFEENQRRARRDICNSGFKTHSTKNDCKLPNVVNEKTIVNIYHHKDCTNERVDEKFITIEDFVTQIKNENPKNNNITIKYIFNVIEEGRERKKNKIKIFGWWVKIK